MTSMTLALLLPLPLLLLLAAVPPLPLLLLLLLLLLPAAALLCSSVPGTHNSTERTLIEEHVSAVSELQLSKSESQSCLLTLAIIVLQLVQ
jgi:hypothetical protein